MGVDPLRPEPTSDLADPEDVAELVRRFYGDVTQDDLLGFHEHVALGWVGPNAEKAKALARNVARVHSTQLLGQAVNVARYDTEPS